MKSRLTAFAVLLVASAVALAVPGQQLPVSAPTLSEWGLVALGLVVAVAAGIGISRRK